MSSGQVADPVGLRAPPWLSSSACLAQISNRCSVAQLCLTLQPHGLYSPPGSSSPGELPQPGIEPVFPALTGRFFTTEPLGKPGYTRVRAHTHTHTHTLSDSFSGEAPVTYTHRHIHTHCFGLFSWGSPSYTHTETHMLAHTHTLRFFSLIGYYKTLSFLCFFPLTTPGIQTQVRFYESHKVALDCNIDYLYEITWCLSLKV